MPDAMTSTTAERTDERGESRQGGAFRYVYCITDGAAPAGFGPGGIGPDEPDVFTIAHRSVAAVVSAAHADKFEIARANLLAHQRVMERVMGAGGTVLPVKFNTIAEPTAGRPAEDRIVRCVLAPRQAELAELLATMTSRIEVGIKGLWPEMKAVYQAIVRDDPRIDALRAKVRPAGSPGPGAAGVAAQMRLGELVKAALESRKQALAARLIARLAPLAFRWRQNKTFGDPMFVNLALLVDQAAMPQIEAALADFERAQPVSGGPVRLRFVGPVPPSNFVELVITWDDEKASTWESSDIRPQASDREASEKGTPDTLN